MINEQLLGYVAAERARGVSDDAIRGALLTQGWKGEDVSLAIGGGVGDPASNTPRPFSVGNLFKGRLGRLQYFNSGLAFGVVTWMISFFMGMMVRSLSGAFFMVVVLLIISVPVNFTLALRRAHDMNWSGLTVLLLCVPIVNLFFILALLFKKGTEGVNTYGPPQADRNILRTLLNT